MTTLIIIAAMLLANMAIGAGVWAAIDCKDHRFYHWYASCPEQLRFWAQPLVLTAWPVGLWLWLRSKP